MRERVMEQSNCHAYSPVYGQKIGICPNEAFMKFFLSKVFFKLQSLSTREDGQDLVEYALVLALISVAAVTSLHNLANKIVAVFNTIGNDL
jgi:pilus assembly protein Flp/PilA